MITRRLELETLQSQFETILENLQPNDEILVTKNQIPIAKLTAPHQTSSRKAGNCKGMLTIVSEDDDHLQDFEEHLR